MGIKEILQSLLGDSDGGFEWVIDPEGLNLKMPKGEFEKLAQGEGTELELLQYAHLRMLDEQGDAERFANGFVIAPKAAVALEFELKQLFQLPAEWPGSFELVTEALTYQPGFTLRIRLRDERDNPINHYQFDGLLLRLGETEVYLPSPAQWEVLSVAQWHADLKGEGRSEHANLMAIHRIHQAKTDGAAVEMRHFETIETVTPGKVGVSAEQTPEGDLILSPTFGEQFDPKTISKRLDQLDPEGDRVQSIRIGDRIVLLDESRLKAAQEIVRNRRIPKEQVRQFLQYPSAYLDASLVDLDSGFSLRVHGATAFRAGYFGETEAGATDWFGRDKTGPLESDVETTLRSAIHDEDDLVQFRQLRHDAEQTGATEVAFNDQLIDISDKAKVDAILADIEQSFAKRPDDSDDEGDGEGEESDDGFSDEEPPITVVDIDLHDEDLAVTSKLSQQIDDILYKGNLDWSGYKCDPLKHQESGVRWMLGLAQGAIASEPGDDDYFGGILADDMGLGKTFMSLAGTVEYLRLVEAAGRTRKPVLVIAPLSLLENWQNEITKFFEQSPFDDIVVLQSGGDLKQYRQAGAGPETRRQQLEVAEDNEKEDKPSPIRISLKIGAEFKLERLDRRNRLVLTTYQTLRDYQFSLCSIPWSVAIFDEAQNIKNPNTLQTRAAKGINAEFLLTMTGTPVENTLADFWCIADTSIPGHLGTYQEFRKRYIQPILAASGDELDNVRAQVGLDLRKSVGTLMLRRLKEDHIDGLPAKRQYIGLETSLTGFIPDESLICQMPPLQRELYDEVIDNVVSSPADQGGEVLRGLHRLREVSLHPALLEGGQLEVPASAVNARKMCDDSGKLVCLLHRLNQIKERREKVLLFVVTRHLQAFLAVALQKVYGVSVDVINGETKATAKRKAELTRQRLIDQFQSAEGFGILIMSPLAAGVGLTVTAANNVIHLERHWNPAKEAQATDRVYRIGQERDVNIYIPILHHPEVTSFDVKLSALLDSKIGLKEAVMAPAIADPGQFDPAEVFGAPSSAEGKGALHFDQVQAGGWKQFEAVVAALMVARDGDDVYLTALSNDKGADVVVVSQSGNRLIQCKHQKQKKMHGDTPVREIYASRKFYEKLLGVTFEHLEVWTTASSFSKGTKEAAKDHRVSLHGRKEITALLDKHPVQRKDVLMRLDSKPLAF